MFNRIVGALERMQYQHASPLFRDLAALFQTSIDALNQDAKFAALSGVGLQEHVASVLVSKVDFIRKIKAIVQSRLNLTIDTVVLHNSGDINALMNCKFHANRALGLFKEAAALAPDTNQSATTEFQSLIERLIKNADTTSGVLREIVDKYYSCDLILYTGLFTLGRFYPNIGSLAADELAAITLHELGHAMTWLEELCKSFDKAIRLRNVMRSITTRLTGDEFEAFKAAIYHESERIGDSEEKRRLQAVLFRLDEVSGISYDMAVKLYVVTIAALTFAASLYAGDLHTTSTTHTYIETITDEWAAMHGAATALNSGFYKTQTAVELGKNARITKAMAASRVLSVSMAKITFLKNLMIYPSVASSKQYEPLIRRMRLAMQSTAEELKDRDLPANLRNDLIETVRESRAMIAEYESRDYVKAREWLWSSLLRICRPGTTREALANGNLTADYQRLQEFTKDLVQSPFAYHVARLQTLKEKAGA